MTNSEITAHNYMSVCQRFLKSSPKRSSKSSPPGKDWMGDFISLEEWAQIRYLRGQGLSLRKIAAEVGCAKETVEKALASDPPPCYKPREAKGTSFDPFEPQVRELIAETP